MAQDQLLPIHMQVCRRWLWCVHRAKKVDVTADSSPLPLCSRVILLDQKHPSPVPALRRFWDVIKKLAILITRRKRRRDLFLQASLNVISQTQKHFLHTLCFIALYLPRLRCSSNKASGYAARALWDGHLMYNKAIADCIIAWEKPLSFFLAQ